MPGLNAGLFSARKFLKNMTRVKIQPAYSVASFVPGALTGISRSFSTRTRAFAYFGAYLSRFCRIPLRSIMQSLSS